MKSRTGHLFTRTIIILMIFFVCLPCTIKIEIKQVLNIPFALAENSENPGKSAACISIIKEKKLSKTVSHLKRGTQVYSSGFNLLFQQQNVLPSNVFLVSKIKKPSSVLIYILHEQYLI